MLRTIVTKLGPIDENGWIEGVWVLADEGTVHIAGNVERDVLETIYGPWIRINDFEGIVLDPLFGYNPPLAAAYEKEYFCKFFYRKLLDERPHKLTLHRAVAFRNLNTFYFCFYIEEIEPFEDSQKLINKYLFHPNSLRHYFNNSNLQVCELSSIGKEFFGSFMLNDWDSTFAFRTSTNLGKFNELTFIFTPRKFNVPSSGEEKA